IEIAGRISKYGREDRGRTCADTIETRQHAVTEPHETQKAQRFFDGRIDLFRRRLPPRLEALAERQQIEDKVRQNARAAADVTAVIEDLPFQFFDERDLSVFELPVVSGNS